MFVCEKCHDKRCKAAFIENLMPSYGRCEGCGKTTGCADCQGYKRLGRFPAAPPAAPSGDASAPAPDRDARPGRPSDQP